MNHYRCATCICRTEHVLGVWWTRFLCHCHGSPAAVKLLSTKQHPPKIVGSIPNRALATSWGRKDLHRMNGFLVDSTFLTFCNSLLFHTFLSFLLALFFKENKREIRFWLQMFDLICVLISPWIYSNYPSAPCSWFRMHFWIGTMPYNLRQISPIAAI